MIVSATRGKQFEEPFNFKDAQRVTAFATAGRYLQGCPSRMEISSMEFPTAFEHGAAAPYGV
jgi:hypothetical protein